MGPFLKICGLMRAEDVSMCCRLGVAICGFVTEYPIAVPWNVTRGQCAELMQYISGMTKSCLVTGGNKEKVISLGRELRPDYIQLHYNETLETVRDIVQALIPYSVKIITTVPNSEEERYRRFGIGNPETCAEKLCQAGVFAILVDSREPSNAASCSLPVSLSLYHRVKSASACQVMLGGGITSDNCKKLILEAVPDIVDVMTGVEITHGVKSEKLVAGLIRQMAVL